jgi:hypothetical protein
MSVKADIKSILSGSIDSSILDDLIESYKTVKDSYIQQDYKKEISESGIFVENIFRVLHYVRTKEVLPEIKQGQFDDISRDLMNSSSKDHPETIRIQIPIVALQIFKIRSKSGAVHVKPIDPDFIDGKLIISACDWIMAELLRIYYDRDADAVWKLILSIVEDKTPIVQQWGDEMFIDAKVTCEQEILIRLYKASEGLDRKQTFDLVARHFGKSNISTSIVRLIHRKAIFQTKEGKYILAGSTRKKVARLLLDLSSQAN